MIDPLLLNLNLNLNRLLQMLCVGCCLVLLGGASAWKQCGVCGWPVCDDRCAHRQEHRAECAAFKRANFKIKPGEWISDVVC